MPKNRKRVATKGAKSVGVQSKHKIGGRKSGKGTNQMGTDEIILLTSVRKRDRNKLRRACIARGVALPV